MLRRAFSLPYIFPSSLLRHPGRLFSNESRRNVLENRPDRVGQKVDISDRCVRRLKEIVKPGEDTFLRVAVDGGGCSGFQYTFELDSSVNSDDKCFEKDGVKIVVDEVSLPFLDGATVDYHEELIKSAFRIVDNPKAGFGCSCGASFGLKDDNSIVK